MSRANKPHAHLRRGTRLLNTLSAMLLPLLEFAMFVQMGVFFAYFVSMPEVQPTNVLSRLRKAATGAVAQNLHPIKVGEYRGMETFYDVRLRQVQDAIRFQRTLSAVNDEDRLSSRKKGMEVDVLPETHGGIEGLTAMMLESVVAGLKSSLDESNSSINEESIKSCYEYGDSSSVVLSDRCKSAHIELSEQTSTLVVFNPLPRKRQWCGHIVEAGQTLAIGDIAACQEDWMNLAIYPPPSLVNSDEDDAIEVVTSQFYMFGNSDEIRRPNCDVPCTWKGAPYGSFKISGTKWEFTQSAEGPQYYEENVIDPKAHLRDQFYSTVSFRSEIPLPYFSFEEYEIKAPDYVSFDKGIKGASFIANNCDSMNNREAMVRGIMATGFRVDCLSGCLHNADPPHGLSMDNKRMLMRQYLFHLAFENQNEDDYITEKLWGSLEAGVIPVYLGAPNVRLHAPEGSIIVAADFASPQLLGEHLQKVANDGEVYEQYHAWRKQDLSDTFLRKYNFTRTHSECRTCLWAYAKKKGLGWNHENQRIAPPHLSREICTDDMSGLASRPFRESYLLYDLTRQLYEDSQSHRILERSSRYETDQASSSAKHPQCSKRGLQSSLVSSHHEIERSLVEHDGVIDIIIAIKYRHMRKGTILPPLFLRLETTISNGREYYTASDHKSPASKRTFNGADSLHWQEQPDGMRYLMIQDPNSRISVWADWTTQMLSTFEGSIDILLLPGEVVPVMSTTTHRKIRVIVEDSNPLHYDTDVGSPTYFAKQQAKDFYHPMEVFYAG